MARKNIGKKLRFEVFKRDSFTCQYCGQSAPEAVLHCDHIQPVSKGGDDDITNLITACKSCNSGKGAVELDDDTVIKKRKAQLDELQERREQLAMMLEWHKELVNLEDDSINAIAEYWESFGNERYEVNGNGRNSIRKWLKRYSVDDILKAIRASTSQYFKYDKDDELIFDSVNVAFDKVPKICGVQRRMENKPYLKDLYYIRGIVRNRMYCNEWRAMQLLEAAYNNGNDIEDLKQWAIEARNWSTWRDQMEEWSGADE